MKPMIKVAGRAYPWGAKNVDTDVIIPAHWLKTVTRDGLGKGAFESVRKQPGNVFDDPRFASAPILIADDNFGCGSSREHAAWALIDFGITAVIAPSFSDIFASNAFKNGIVTVVQPAEMIAKLIEIAQRDDLAIDLDSMTISAAQMRLPFSLDPFRRKSQMEGLDEVGITLSFDNDIAAYEREMTTARPWIERPDHGRPD